MNPTKTIVDQAEAALRLFFAESREDAGRLLEMYGPLVHMFEQDVDAAVEVRSLVLDRFPSAEPPSVPGKDWLPGATVFGDAAEVIKVALSESPGTVLTAAKVKAAAEAVAVLDEPAPESVTPPHLYVFGKHDIPWCPACKRESEQSSVHSYTTDGHPCCGLATVGDRPNRRARCGGVTLCRRCSADASRIHGAQAVPFGPVAADGEAQS